MAFYIRTNDFASETFADAKTSPSGRRSARITRPARQRSPHTSRGPMIDPRASTEQTICPRSYRYNYLRNRALREADSLSAHGFPRLVAALIVVYVSIPIKRRATPPITVRMENLRTFQHKSDFSPISSSFLFSQISLDLLIPFGVKIYPTNKFVRRYFLTSSSSAILRNSGLFLSRTISNSTYLVSMLVIYSESD